MNENVPERFRGRCWFNCAYPELDTRADGVYQFTTGWVKNRSAGGGNAIALPKRENKWAHSWCIDKATSGTLRQGSLFGEPSAEEAELPPPEPDPPSGFVGIDHDGHFLHYCHCGAWAEYGFNVSYRDGKLGQWYCTTHRPKEKASP